MKRNFTVRRGALDGIEAFLCVARHRSFRKAAAELGVTPSAISQTVRTLEKRIGAPLFVRTTRSVGLTEAGEQFLLRAKPAFEELVAAGDVVRGLGQRPTGRLRLSVPPSVMPVLLEPLISSFSKACPEVEVEVEASAKLVDIAAEGFDAGIRLGQFVAADMVAVRLTPPIRFIVVASPAYLKRRKAPTSIDDLRRHACLCMRRSNGAIAPWLFTDGDENVEAMVSGPFIAGDYPALLAAAIGGMGPAQVPEPIASDALRTGKLVQLLEPFAARSAGLFLYYPDRRQVLPKLRAFIDHVKYRTSAPGELQIRVKADESDP